MNNKIEFNTRGGQLCQVVHFNPWKCSIGDTIHVLESKIELIGKNVSGDENMDRLVFKISTDSIAKDRYTKALEKVSLAFQESKRFSQSVDYSNPTQKKFYLAYRFNHENPHWCINQVGRSIPIGAKFVSTDSRLLHTLLATHEAELDIIKSYELAQ